MSKTVDNNKRDWEFVYRNGALLLPLRLRVAWATTVVDRVHALFSPYFQSKFGTQEAINYSWRFAEGAADSPSERAALSRRLQSSIQAAESEGYWYFQLYPSFLLLNEIEMNDGKGGTQAVDYSASAYICAILYRFGASIVPIEFRRELEDPLLRFAWQVYVQAKNHPTAKIVRKMFDSIILPEPAQLPPSEVLAISGDVPQEELRFLGKL